jgi:hypothetical protein
MCNVVDNQHNQRIIPSTQFLNHGFCDYSTKSAPTVDRKLIRGVDCNKRCIYTALMIHCVDCNVAESSLNVKVSLVYAIDWFFLAKKPFIYLFTFYLFLRSIAKSNNV